MCAGSVAITFTRACGRRCSELPSNRFFEIGLISGLAAGSLWIKHARHAPISELSVKTSDSVGSDPDGSGGHALEIFDACRRRLSDLPFPGLLFQLGPPHRLGRSARLEHCDCWSCVSIAYCGKVHAPGALAPGWSARPNCPLRRRKRPKTAR